MRRTGAITQKVPTFSSDDYRTFMIGDFKGIDKSVNPFNAIKSSAEECLNLYVDDEGTLTTRPRLDCQSDIVGDELPWNPAEDAIRNSFEFDYNGTHYHAITTNQRQSDKKTYWGLSSDFITWEGFVDDGGNTVSELFNNGDVLYAIIRNGIYTTAINFTTHKISFTKAVAYVPTTGTYDAASGIRVTAGEQENLLINEYKTEVFWNPTNHTGNKNLLALKYSFVSNGYLKTNKRLTYNNAPLLKWKAYKNDKVIVGTTDNQHIVVFSSTGDVMKTYDMPVDNITQLDFDYSETLNCLLIGCTHGTSNVSDFYLFKDTNTCVSVIPTQTWATGLSAIRIPACCINPTAEEAFITTDIVSGGGTVRYGWTVKLSDSPTVVSKGKLGYHFIKLFWSNLLNAYVGECVSGLDRCFAGILATVKNDQYLTIDAVVIALTSPSDTKPVCANIYENDSNIYVNLYSGGSRKIYYKQAPDENGSPSFTREPLQHPVEFPDETGFELIGMTGFPANTKFLQYGSATIAVITLSESLSLMNTCVTVFADGNMLAYDTLILYNASTKPLLVIRETSKETSEITLEHVGRYNNNYVYWSTTSNKVYYTANNNPLYIPKSFYDDYGDDTPVTGVMRISDSYLAVLKQDATYLAWFDSETGYFYANELRTEKGNIAVAQAIVCNYSNLPVVINTDGFWGLGQSTSVNYQDTVYSSLSDALRVELQKLDLTKCKTHNHKYLTYFAVPNGDSTTIYVLDNRIQMWFKWVIPIDLKFFAEYEDYIYIYTATSVFKLDPYTAHTNGDLNDAWYADTINAVGSTKHIPWLWVSQPLYLGTLNYKKRIRYMKFLFDNKYESESVTMRYGFLSYKQSERPTKLREYTSPFTRNTFSNEITGITKQVATLKTKKIRPYIPSFDFIQIILRSNNDSDEFEDADGNIITPTLNDKVGLIGLTINYILQEG